MRQALSLTFAVEALLKVSQLATFFIWLNFLSPTELGLATQALLIASAAQVLWQHPANKYLVSLGEHYQSATSLVNRYNLLTAIFPICVVATLIATGVATNLQLYWCILAALLANVIYAYVSGFIAADQARRSFESYGLVRSTSIFVNFSATFFCLFLNFGYVSLIVGYVAGAVGQALALMLYRKKTVNIKTEAAMVSGAAEKPEFKVFTVSILISQSLIWSMHFLDTSLVALSLDESTLGEYRLAQQIVIAFFGFIYSAFLPVYFSYRSTMNDVSRRQTITKDIEGNILFNLIFSSGFLGMAFVAELVVPLEGWVNLYKYMILTIVAYSFLTLITFIGELLRADRKTTHEMIIYFLIISLLLILYAVLPMQDANNFLFVKIGSLCLCSITIVPLLLKKNYGNGGYLHRSDFLLLMIISSFAVYGAVNATTTLSYSVILGCALLFCYGVSRLFSHKFSRFNGHV